MTNVPPFVQERELFTECSYVAKDVVVPEVYITNCTSKNGESFRVMTNVHFEENRREWLRKTERMGETLQHEQRKRHMGNTMGFGQKKVRILNLEKWSISEVQNYGTTLGIFRRNALLFRFIHRHRLEQCSSGLVGTAARMHLQTGNWRTAYKRDYFNLERALLESAAIWRLDKKNLERSQPMAEFNEEIIRTAAKLGETSLFNILIDCGGLRLGSATAADNPIKTIRENFKAGGPKRAAAGFDLAGTKLLTGANTIGIAQNENYLSLDLPERNLQSDLMEREQELEQQLRIAQHEDGPTVERIEILKVRALRKLIDFKIGGPNSSRNYLEQQLKSICSGTDGSSTWLEAPQRREIIGIMQERSDMEAALEHMDYMIVAELWFRKRYRGRTLPDLEKLLSNEGLMRKYMGEAAAGIPRHVDKHSKSCFKRHFIAFCEAELDNSQAKTEALLSKRTAPDEETNERQEPEDKENMMQ